MVIAVLLTLDQITQPPSNSRTLEVLLTPLYGGESFTFGIKPVRDHMCGEDLKQIIGSWCLVNGV